jgi:hypothetical protein
LQAVAVAAGVNLEQTLDQPVPMPQSPDVMEQLQEAVEVRATTSMPTRPGQLVKRPELSLVESPYQRLVAFPVGSMLQAPPPQDLLVQLVGPEERELLIHLA